MPAPTIVTPSLLNLVLALGFYMESWDTLTTGLHPFVIGQHTATFRKFLLGQADWYAVVASGAGALSLKDVEILLAPDGVTLTLNLSIARGQWLRNRLIFRTCFGVYHNASKALEEITGRRCRQGRRTWRSTSLATRPSAPRFWRSSSTMHRFDCQTGSQRSAVGRPRSLSLTWWVSGLPWKIMSPPRATPSCPKMSTEAVLVLAQPPNLPIQKVGPQWTPQLFHCQRPPLQQLR